jgi:cell division protein ZapD
VNKTPVTTSDHESRLHNTTSPERRNITSLDQICYEQPLNERVRTLLRLEFLFKQAHAHTYRHSVWDSRAALNSLFDITEIFTRADLKNEILKELERQATLLEKLAENPHVDKRRLEEILSEMDLLIDRLYALRNQDMDIRTNDFLSSIKQRSNIAGGGCDFDLPAYHYWLSQPEEKRVLDLQHWIEPFDAINQSVRLILRLIRDSGQTTDEIADDGFYQKSLDTSTACQMVRVTLAGDMPYFAEISGGKHRFTIRFMEPSLNDRPIQTAQTVNFKLTCCML